MNPLVAELIALLPLQRPWPDAERERWLAAMTTVVHLVYAEPTAPDPTYQGNGGADLDLRTPARGRHARPQFPNQPADGHLTSPGPVALTVG